MRRMILLVAVCFLGAMTGCCNSGGCGGGCGDGGCGSRGGGYHIFPQGICDCEPDDHCQERAPWLRMGAPVQDQTPAAKLPDGKKL